MPNVGSPALQGADNPFDASVSSSSSLLNPFDVRAFAATAAQLSVLGNGLPKPLSGFYATLAAAQIDYPAASALSDELDWAVIQACTTAAANATVNTAIYTIGGFSAPLVVFPGGGAYIINRAVQVNLTTTLNGGSYTNFRAEGHILIKQTDNTKSIVFWANTGNGNYDNKFENIDFGGGARQIVPWNGENGPALLVFKNCSFLDSADYAIYVADEPNTIVIVEQSRWVSCKKLLYNNAEKFVVRECWFTGSAANSPGNAALIYNLGGTLVIDNFDGSPDMDAAAGTRWIDNFGASIQINRSRFGGEGASGGIGVVWQYAFPVSPLTAITSVSIRDSDLACGNVPSANIGCLNYRTGVPLVQIMEGNRYFANGPKVVNGGALVPATYFGAFPQTYLSRVVFKAQLEPEVKFGDEITADANSFPSAFRPYIAGLSGSPRMFHTGGAAAKSFTEGTDSTPVNTEFYFAEVYVDANTFVTGVSVLNGSVASGNFKAGLFDASGALLIASGSTAQAGVNAYQRVPFNTGLGSGGYTVQLPGTYYIGVFVDNSTARIRTHAAGDFGAGKKTAQDYATGFTPITPPSTFAAGLAVIASLF